MSGSARESFELLKQTQEYKEWRRRIAREYYKAHKDEICARYRGSRREYAREYYQKNREAILARLREKRQVKNSSAPTVDVLCAERG